MKYLVIDRTMVQPIRLVVEDGRTFGNTQLLDWQEVPQYARWLGLVGGRELLDAFEVKLINEGMIWVWPVDADGEPLHDECNCEEIRRYDDGPRLVWTPKLRCETCFGQGHYVMDGRPVEEEDICLDCAGNGWTWGSEFETDMHGEPLPANALGMPPSGSA